MLNEQCLPIIFEKACNGADWYNVLPRNFNVEKRRDKAGMICL